MNKKKGLKLVNPTKTDAYRLYSHLKNDRDNFETFAGVPYSWKAVKQFKNYFIKLDRCYSVVYDKGLRCFLGYVAVTDFINNEAVIEFYVVKKHRNKGYAYESCRTLIEHIVSSYKEVNKFRAVCTVENVASQNLLLKLGFKPKDEIVNLMLIDGKFYEKACIQYTLEL